MLPMSRRPDITNRPYDFGFLLATRFINVGAIGDRPRGFPLLVIVASKTPGRPPVAPTDPFLDSGFLCRGGSRTAPFPKT